MMLPGRRQSGCCRVRQVRVHHSSRLADRGAPMVDENAGELLRKYDPAQPDFDLYPELHRVCPVAAVGDHVWLISRYKDVLSVALDDDSFPSGPAFGYPDGIPEEGSPE